MYVRHSHGWEEYDQGDYDDCRECKKLEDKLEDIFEFTDMVLKILCRGERPDFLIGHIDEIYSKFGYILPKEIIESLEVKK